MEEGSLGTCSVGLLQRRRLIRADKGEIRRFKMGESCARWTNRLKRTAGKTNRWEVEEGGKTARQRKLKCKTSVHKNRLNAAC